LDNLSLLENGTILSKNEGIYQNPFAILFLKINTIYTKTDKRLEYPLTKYLVQYLDANARFTRNLLTAIS